MKILVCNAGSTSLKFKFYEMPECRLYAQGHVERVGSADDAVFHYRNVISGGSADLEKQKRVLYFINTAPIGHSSMTVISLR